MALLPDNKSDLTAFFIFNPSFGPKEGEEEKKILFYFPLETSLNTQIKEVGLCEAFIQFCRRFTTKNIQTVHTLKRRKVFLEPEPGFWMVMIISIPCVSKTENGLSTQQYHDEEIQDSLCEALLRKAYHMFKLFMGTFNFILKRHMTHDSLKQRFCHFYKRYLLTVAVDSADILDLFGGVHFLPLDKRVFLKVQCFVNSMEASIHQICCSAFLFQDCLVWSGLQPEDMTLLYYYLTTSLLPAHHDKELHLASSTASNANGNYGRFVTGPPNLADTKYMGKIPHVFIHLEGSLKECYLVVYRALRASICLFLDASFPITFDTFVNLDAILGPQLTQLAGEINEQTQRQNSLILHNHVQDTSLRYVYFNHMNMAQKSSLHISLEGSALGAKASLSGTGSALLTISFDTMRLVVDLNAEINREENDDSEIIAKSSTDAWIIAKKSDHREFYAAVNQRNANLIEVNEEVKRLCAKDFSSIFFLD